MRAWLCAGVLALVLSPAPAASDDLELYRPRHRLPDELAPIAAGVLGDEGQALVDPGTGAIVLRGRPDALRQVLDVLASLDQPLASFEIESQVTSASELERLGISVEGWVELGDLRIGRGPVAGEGLVVRAGQSLRTGQRQLRGVVSVREGATADLWMGSLQPTVVHRVARGDEEPEVHPTPYLRSTRSGFRVRPRSLEDGGVELEIQPVLSQDSLDQPVLETSASTRVRVRPGEWVALGAIGRSESSSKRDLAALDQRQSSLDQVILVRVTRRAGFAESDARPASPRR